MLELPTLIERAEALRLLGRLDEASVAYQRAIDGTTAPPSAHLMLARVFFELGDLNQCLAVARRLVKLDPAGVSGDCARALIAVGEGQIENGIGELSHVLFYHPDHVQAYIFRAHFLMMAGRPSEACEDYSSALTRLTASYQEDPSARLGRAKALLALGQRDQAASDFRCALLLGADHPRINLPRPRLGRHLKFPMARAAVAVFSVAAAAAGTVALKGF